MGSFCVRISIFILVFLAARGANAADLNEIVTAALRDNALLKSENARADEARMAGAYSRRWPGLSLDVLGGRRRDEMASGAIFEAGFSQPLPLGNKPSLRGQLLDVDAQSWQVRRSVSEADLTFDIVRVAFQYAVQRRLAELAQKRQQRFALIKSYLDGRVFVSPQKKAERNIVENRLKNLLADAMHSESDMRVAFERLRAYVPADTNLSADIVVPWFAGARVLDLTQIVEKARAANPDLKLQDLAIKRAQVEHNLAARDRWLEPKVLGSYENAHASGREQNTKLGLGLDFPAWSRTRAGVQSAQYKTEAEQALRMHEQWLLEVKLSQAVGEYDAARRIVREYPLSLLAELDAQLRDAEQGFRKGQTDLLTFLELENSAAETYGRALESQLALLDNAIEIYRLSGQRDIVGQLDSF